MKVVWKEVKCIKIEDLGVKPCKLVFEEFCEKGVMEIKLVNGLIISKCYSRSNAKNRGFDNRAKDINVVDATGLMVSFDNKVNLVEIKIVSNFLFVWKTILHLIMLVLGSEGITV